MVIDVVAVVVGELPEVGILERANRSPVCHLFYSAAPVVSLVASTANGFVSGFVVK